MKIPISWVKEYVDFQETPEVIADLLTMGGVEIGNIDVIGKSWKDDLVICGKILSIDPHPNADRLQLATVDIGEDGPTIVVCGAPNIEVGQTIAFAKSGSTLVNPKTGSPETLKVATIRGVESSGMVCSALELGIEGDHDGILVLGDDHAPGIPLREVLGDAILEIELTPNRPDCLSIIGNSYEIGALTKNIVKMPDTNYPTDGEPTDQLISVHIEDESLCARYTGLCISEISVKPSPQWMQDILLKSGQRPINNIVDITNYVMLETGQPLHAFDLSEISGQTISVRKAQQHEKIMTLDKQTHTLKSPMLVIADEHKPIGIAGIMGGISSEVNEETTEIFLESANFNNANIRTTRTGLGLNTEASYRFERNLRPELAPVGLSRAALLINQLAGGKISNGIVDLYPGKQIQKPIHLSEDRIRKILGTKFPLDTVWDILQSLGFQEYELTDQLTPKEDTGSDNTDSANNSDMWVLPPYWRSDIEIEDDLVEEFSRIYGYNNLPSKTLNPDIVQPEYYPELSLRESIRDNLVSAAMIECINYSVSEYEALRVTGSIKEIAPPVVIANPMDSNKKYLRTSLRSNLLRTLSQNRSQSYEAGIRLFEIGHVFSQKAKNDVGDLPNESENIAGLISGPRQPEFLWAQDNHSMDFFDLKGILEYCFSDISGNLVFERSNKQGFEPGSTARVNFNGAPVGWIGQTTNEVNNYFDLGQQNIFLFELNLDAIYRISELKTKKFVRASRFPSSFRDMSVIGKDSVTANEITQIILSDKLVTEAYILDTYRDDEIGYGNTSLTVRIVYQSMNRTLKASDIDKTQEKLFGLLEKKLGVKQRFTG